MKGKFITFEGCEGSGKSTQIKLLSAYLTDLGIEHILTREPGGNAISEEIRKLILDTKNSNMSDECEALLYSASRVQHLKDKVLPALESGVLVLCDRYVDSSFAYQGYARGLGDFVDKVNCFALEKAMPDCTIFIDIRPEDAFARKKGADKDDRMEQAGLEFHKKVYDGYKKVASENKQRFVLIDGYCDVQTTFDAILTALKEKSVI